MQIVKPHLMIHAHAQIEMKVKFNRTLVQCSCILQLFPFVLYTLAFVYVCFCVFFLFWNITESVNSDNAGNISQYYRPAFIYFH